MIAPKVDNGDIPRDSLRVVEDLVSQGHVCRLKLPLLTNYGPPALDPQSMAQPRGAAGSAATERARRAGAPGGDARPDEEREPETVRLPSLLREVWAGWRSPGEWHRKSVLRLLWVFVVTATSSWAGIMLSHQSGGVATIWLSNGMIFGLLITQPPRRWLPYFVAGLSADTIADLVYGDPFRVAIGVSLANSIEVVMSALVLTRLFGTPLDLSKRRPLVGFLLISVVGATAITSALGASWTLLFYDAGPWWTVFRTWWLGDLLGMSILAPLTVMLQRRASYSILRARTLPRTLLVLLVPVAVTVLVFTHDTDPLIFFLFPTLLLAAFRLGFPGTVFTIVVVTLMSIAFTVKGHGPLMLIAGEHMLLRRIVVAQVFAAVSIFTMFPVAALLEQKDALQVSLAASEARFRALAQTDELTGLANRRAFNLRLQMEWEQARLAGAPLALVLIDADHFKQYNDVFGHLEGDECLRALARLINLAVGRSPAMASRYGGEEFAVLLPGTDAENARLVAESIRETIAAERLPHPTGPLGIQTVSLGATSIIPTNGLGSEVLVSRADEALYCAKLSGRDQVSVL